MAVETEFDEHAPAKAAHQEVGEDIYPGFVGEQGPHLLNPGEHVVTVQPRKATDVQTFAHVVQCPIGTAVRVSNDNRPAPSLQLPCQSLDPGRDLAR